MSLTGGSKFILTGGATNYQIARSLRFRSGNSAYLNRTFGSPSNSLKWTYSTWVKRGQISVAAGMILFNSAASSGWINFGGSDLGGTLDTINAAGDTAGDPSVHSVNLLRDPSAWYHVVVKVDTTQATAADRIRIYVNGVEVAYSGSPTYPTQNTAYKNFNTAVVHYMGNYIAAAHYYYDGLLAETIFIDGQALTPSSFGQTDATTGAWGPIAYAGTYGNNGFKLNFSDNSAATSTTIGKDSSGNGNNWTPNNFSVTAGVTNDSLVDTPTNYGSDTGAGGEVRGSYATLNPLACSSNITLSEGNLKATVNGSGNNNYVVTTLPMIAGSKWVFTAQRVSGTWFLPGVTALADISSSNLTASNSAWYSSLSCFIQPSGAITVAGSNVQTGLATWTDGDVMRMEFDYSAATPTIQFYKNGTAWGTAVSMPAGLYFPSMAIFLGAAGIYNFGQTPFLKWNGSAYVADTASSGYKALCTQNLPTPAIVKPSLYMDVNTRTGTGAAFSVTGKLFQPDIIWTKSRSAAKSHAITDSQFGTGKYWSSDGSAAYVSDAQAVTAFNSDGFSGGTAAIINTSAESLVDWLFKKSVTAGIDLVKFSGNSTNRTIAHSLGVAPSMLIVKRDGANGATIWHTGIGSAANYLALFSTAASAADAAAFNSTAPTSSVFSVGTNNNTNATGTNNMLAMLFAEVAGFSKFGSYTGNGSTDGPFVWCGFRPRFIMFKKISATDDWEIIDTARNSFNGNDNGLFPSWSGAEQTSRGGDVLSNGIKLRYANGTTNESGQTHIFAAFAESPFKTARAR